MNIYLPPLENMSIYFVFTKIMGYKVEERPQRLIDHHNNIPTARPIGFWELKDSVVGT